MSSLYRSLSLYWRHHIPLGLCSPSAKIMGSSYSHTRAFSSGDGPSPIPNKRTTSPESFSSEGNYPPLAGSKNKSGEGSRRSKLDLGSTNLYTIPSKRLQPRKDDLSLKRDHMDSRCKNRDQSPKRRQDLPFDICSSGNDRCITQQYREEEEANGEETEQTVVEFGKKHRVPGPGMVLLKHYLIPDVQVDIVKTCRELGVNPKGFYQPGYRVCSKLHLQMMCLGRNWDPQTKYTEIDSKPPNIPDTFCVLVEEAIREAQALIDRETGAEDAETILPAMSPDICIVNFYLETGRLGLHQDRDESRESREKGLPIVSFSIGDSAEFLYGEERDVEEAEQVKLESGDVLIFGGESRMIFHGVKSIIPNSAPKFLLDESKLRPGRLNLTFRHF